MGVSSGWPYGWLVPADYVSMSDLGATWLRADVSQGQTLASTDGWVLPALRAGIQVLGILQPSQVNPSVTAAWAKTVAEHYAPLGVHVWEFRNECNWAGTNVPVASYTPELKAVYDAIHSVDPHAIVLTGGSVPALGQTNSATNYLAAIYANGGGGHFDGVASHPYDGGQSVVQTWPEIDSMIALHDICVAHGDAAKLVWATEVGFTTVTGVSSGFTEANTATMLGHLVDRLVTLAGQGVAAPMVGYYSLKDRPQTSVRESHFGLLRTDRSQKPAYATFKQLAAALV